MKLLIIMIQKYLFLPPHKTHYISIKKTICLVLLKYLVCFDNHAQRVNTHCGQHTEFFLNVETGSTNNIHCV